MNTKPKFHLILSFFLVLLLLVTGCRQAVGDLQTESHTVEAAGAESAVVEINMGAGELEVNGGAAELFAGDFTYNIDSWKPTVDYGVNDGSGRLTVSQQGTLDGLPFGNNIRNEWNLRLNDEMPLEIVVRFGAGEGRLNLASLNLTSLNIEGGAGTADIVLGGSPLESLNISSGVGETTLDLTGEWENDLNATITGGVGELTLRLPTDVGVRIETQTGLGDVVADGFSQNGDVYTNNVYGESAVTLNISVTGGVGEITLELGE